MDTIMKTALAWLLTYAIHSTLLLGLAWAVTRRDTLSAYRRDFIWKLALVGAVVTASAQLGLGVRPMGSFALRNPAAAAVAERGALHQTSPRDEKGLNGATAHESGNVTDATVTRPYPGSAESVPSSVVTTPAPTVAPVSMEAALVIGWFALAMLLTGAYLARRLMLVGRLANRRAITDGALPDMLNALRRGAGHLAPVTLTSVNTISSPVALGLREICVPVAVLTELEPDQQRGLLAHELAHLARRDPLWLDAASVMERVFFFQPLNRLARREIQRNAEYLCDDWAAARTGSGLPLAHCLARVAEWSEASPLGVPVAGMAEQRSLLVTRIARLIEGKTAGSPMSRAMMTAAAVVLFAGVIAAAPGVKGARVALTAVSPDTVLPASRVIAAASAQATIASSPELTAMPRGISGAAAPMLAGVSSGVLTARSPSLARVSGERAVEEDSAVIAALVERLKDTDAGVRRAAANALGNLRSRIAVLPLIAVLTDRNKDVREAACDALGNLRDVRAVPALVARLSDESQDVREQALDALSNFAEELTASQILPALQDPRPNVRAKAAEILGQIGDRSASSALTRLLNDASHDVRQNGIEALSQLKDPSAGPAMLSALRDTEDDVRSAALDALRELKVQIPEAQINASLVDPSANVRQKALEYLKDNLTLANAAVVRRMLDDSNGDVREQAVDVLAEMHNPEARAALKVALNSTDHNVRRRAVEALGERP